MRDNKDDLNFVRDKFEADGLKVPDSLSEDAIRVLIAAEPSGAPAAPAADKEQPPAAGSQPVSTPDTPQSPAADKEQPPADQAPAPLRKHRWTRPLIAAAACAALVIALIPLLQQVLPGGSEGPAEPVAMTADATGLYAFRSYNELDREMKSLLPEESDSYDTGVQLFSNTEDLAEAPAEDSDLAAGDEGMAYREEADAETYGNDSAPTLSGNPQAKGADTAGGTANDSASSSDTSDPQHSQTYTQVKDIDEADIVKTDGNYIYYLSSVENQIIIAKAKNGKASRVSAIGGATDGSYIDDIYVNGDQLIIIGAGEIARAGSGDDSWTDTTTVTIYDISDRTAPKKQTEYAQTGRLLSSRLMGTSLCLITNDRIYSYRKGMNLPYVSYDAGAPEKLPLGDIRCFPQVRDPAYTVIGLLDTTTGKASRDTVRTKAVLGGSDEIYCSGTNLYIAGMINGAEASLPDPGYWQPCTQVLKVSLAGGKVKYKASAILNGTVNNQWSMDERGGYFRVATTSEHDGEDVNNLFILDKKMKEVGSLIGFARDEHIEAVRYIKDKAYVITYRQTDPLFIIDLSDPTAPVIEGHVKISGFSTLLVPSDADHLLGLGFSTEENEFGEATDGVKLALFDISDPSHPKVADSKAFKDMSSPVQYNHRALLVGPLSGNAAGGTGSRGTDDSAASKDDTDSAASKDTGNSASDGSGAAYYAIPYEIAPAWDEWDGVEIEDDAEMTEDIEEPMVNTEESSDSESADTSEDGLTASEPPEPSCGILVFSAKAGKLQVLRDLKTSESVKRCIYIGDYIYGICTDDSIEGFKLK